MEYAEQEAAGADTPTLLESTEEMEVVPTGRDTMAVREKSNDEDVVDSKEE